MSFVFVIQTGYRFYTSFFLFIYILSTANKKHDDERFSVEQEREQARRQEQQEFHAAKQQEPFSVVFE